MASPIVCVAKKNGGVRIACDYRYLNLFTVGDAYSMPTVDKVLRSIGKGRFISTFNAKSVTGFLVVNMDQLTLAQKSAIDKSFSDKLRLHLLKAGFQEEAVLAFTREEFMQKYAELLVRGDPVEKGVVKTVDPELEKMRFEHEERMKKMEMELRLAEMAAKKEKLDAKSAAEKKS